MKTTDIKWNRSQDGIVASKCGTYRIEQMMAGGAAGFDDSGRPFRDGDGKRAFLLFILQPWNPSQLELVVRERAYRTSLNGRPRNAVWYPTQSGAKAAAFRHQNPEVFASDSHRLKTLNYVPWN